MAEKPSSRGEGQETEPNRPVCPTLGAYRLLHLLGEGGMGRVYFAKHLVSEAVVAVKVLRPEFAVNERAVRRFILEAQAVRRLAHPHIIRVEDIVVPEQGCGALFYVMEYLTGIDLKRELEIGSMPLPRAAAIALQICEALQAVHEAGIVHRDLKPANIFLVHGDDFVKVLDFGLAKLEQPGPDGVSTTAGHLIGTPAYMSPEQAAGVPIDRRSDIYSLGVILYEMFTGRRPFEASSFGGFVMQHLSVVPIRPSDLSPPGMPLPAAVDRIVLRCLEKQPDKRYGSAAELAEALGELVPRQSSRTAVPLRHQRRPLELTRWNMLGLSIAGGLIAVAIYALMGGDSSRPQAKLPRVTAEAAPVAATGQAAQLRATSQMITVQSVPTGAQVFASDAPAVPLGTTPLRLERANGQILLLRKAGHDDIEVNVESNGPALLEVHLPKTAAAKRPRAPSALRRRTIAAPAAEQQSLDHVTMDPFGGTSR